MNMRTDKPMSATGSNQRATDGRRRGFVTGMTEARPGIMTTEFGVA
jgi:hypothetical protein